MATYSNPVIALEANSLYIATSQIFSEVGLFHWALYLTDAAGVATKLHWMNLGAGHPSGKWEGVVIATINPTTTYSRSFAVTFAYLKVGGFTTPGLEAFRRIAHEAFPADRRLGFATLQQNRMAGLSCVTWVLYVLASLQTAGWLRRAETPQWFEQTVVNISTYLEQKAERREFTASHVQTI